MTFERLLRNVDGWPHVVLGPLLLVLTSPISDALGVDAVALVVFLAVFTVYGLVVLLGLRQNEVRPWLAATAIAVNVAFAVVVAISLAYSDLTGLGTALHVLLLLNGIGVTVMLLRVSRPYFGFASGRG